MRNCKGRYFGKECEFQNSENLTINQFFILLSDMANFSNNGSYTVIVHITDRLNIYTGSKKQIFKEPSSLKIWKSLNV